MRIHDELIKTLFHINNLLEERYSAESEATLLAAKVNALVALSRYGNRIDVWEEIPSTHEK